MSITEQTRVITDNVSCLGLPVHNKCWYYYFYYHNNHHHHHQGIYTYIPETNYVPREYGVAAILLLLFMMLISLVSVLNLLYFHISTFRSMCAVPNMAVLCSSLTSCFPGMLPTYFLNDFELLLLLLLGESHRLECRWIISEKEIRRRTTISE